MCAIYLSLIRAVIFRNFAHYISAPKIAITNPNCSVKTEVLCDRSEPTVEITLLPAIAGISYFIYQFFSSSLPKFNPFYYKCTGSNLGIYIYLQFNNHTVYKLLLKKHILKKLEWEVDFKVYNLIEFTHVTYNCKL